MPNIKISGPNGIFNAYMTTLARKGGSNFDKNAATLADQRTTNFFKVNLA